MPLFTFSFSCFDKSIKTKKRKVKFPIKTFLVKVLRGGLSPTIDDIESLQFCQDLSL